MLRLPGHWQASSREYRLIDGLHLLETEGRIETLRDLLLSTFSESLPEYGIVNEPFNTSTQTLEISCFDNQARFAHHFRYRATPISDDGPATGHCLADAHAESLVLARTDEYVERVEERLDRFESAQPTQADSQS